MLNDYNDLLVLCETSNTTKISLKNAFVDFSLKYNLPVDIVLDGIDKHDLFITNGEFYFKYNSRLPFLQKFRSSQDQVMRLEDFYNTFAEKGLNALSVDDSRTWFWTITRKTFALNEPVISLKERKTKYGNFVTADIDFQEIKKCDDNLRALFTRLKRYGFDLNKYILVPEIKDTEEGLINYHYHMIVEPKVNLKKFYECRAYKEIYAYYLEKFNNKEIDSIPELVRIDGYIHNSILSHIWKEITEDGSYRILPEEIKDKKGCFHYILSYLNKPMQYRNVANVPYLYYALKSKKAYRVKGDGRVKLPKITSKLYDLEDNRIRFSYNNIKFIERSKIKKSFQVYKIKYYKNDVLIREVQKTDLFHLGKSINTTSQTTIKDYQVNKSGNIKKILDLIRSYSSLESNYQEILNVIGQESIDYLIRVGEIFLVRSEKLEVLD